MGLWLADLHQPGDKGLWLWTHRFPLWFDQMSWLDLFGSGTATVLLHVFVRFWVICFCIGMERVHVLYLLKGAHTSENKSRNSSWSVPKLPLVLGGLGLPLPKCTMSGLFAFVFQTEKPGFCNIFEFWKPVREGSESFALSREAEQGGTGGTAPVLTARLQELRWQWALLKLALVVPLFGV